jgi:hypothetical protein
MRGGEGGSPKSNPARQHRDHVAQLEKRSDCGKVGHANGRATSRSYPSTLEFVQRALNRDPFAVSLFIGQSVGYTFHGSSRLDDDMGKFEEPPFGNPAPS